MIPGPTITNEEIARCFERMRRVEAVVRAAVNLISENDCPNGWDDYRKEGYCQFFCGGDSDSRGLFKHTNECDWVQLEKAVERYLEIDPNSVRKE